MFRSHNVHQAASPAPAPATDPVAAAQESVDRLAVALATAEKESSAAKAAYDREMRDFVASGKQEPSLEPQRVAAGRAESLRRLLGEARDHLTRAVNEAEDVSRLDAIRASGSLVAELTGAADEKLAKFQAAVNAVREAESELFAVLFDPQTGLKQRFAIAESQRDADFARNRLRHQAIRIAERSHCPINAKFETDGEVHLGPLERAFYGGR